METDNVMNAVAETVARIPAESTTQKVTTVKSKTVPAFSTLKDGKSANSVTAVSESYSETIVYTTNNAATGNVEVTNSVKTNKVRRSGRPKVIVTSSNQVTNGKATKTKDVVTTTSTPVVSKSSKKVTIGKAKAFEAERGGDFSSDEDDTKAVKFYSQSGEWWNVFPKTDYTYSPLSEDRKEVAPGVLALPNMSRRSIASTRGVMSPTSHYTGQILSSRHTETITRSRFFQAQAGGRKVSERLLEDKWASPDSDVDEVDEAFRASVVDRSQTESVNYLTAFFTTIWTVVTTTWSTTVETVWSTIGRITGNRVATGYSSKHHYVSTSRNWWQKVTDWIYLMFVRMDVLDTRILSSLRVGSESDQRTRQRRTKYFIWALLLLLLLLCGYWFWANADDATFAPVTAIVSEYLAAPFGAFMMAASRKEDDIYVTSAVPELLHASEGTVEATYASQVTVASGQTIDVDKLTAQVVNSRQMQLLLAANQREINLEALILHVVNSKQMQATIQSSQKEIDVRSLTAEIIAGGEFQKLIAANQKEVDFEAVTSYVLGSRQMLDFLASQKKEPDVNALISQILASGQLLQFVTANQKQVDLELLISQILGSVQFQDWMTANQKDVDIEGISSQVINSAKMQQWKAANEREVDIDRLVAQVVSSGQFTKLLSVPSEGVGKDREILLKRSELQQEQLDEKSAVLEEQKRSLAQLSEELALVKEQALLRDAFHDTLHQKVTGLEDQIKLLQDQQESFVQSVRTCCDQPPALPLVAIEQHVSRFLAGIFGHKGTSDLSEEELKAWIANVFVAKDDLEARLQNFSVASKDEFREAVRLSAQTLMSSISDEISRQFVHQQQHDGSVTVDGLTGAQIREIVNDALLTYDADKTGMVDYALESSGGQILSTRCTEIYYKRSGSYMMFGIPLWRHQPNNPRSVLQPGVHPGECWAFAGSRGYLVIELAGTIRISSFSVEHIPRSLAFAGVIDSAPKDFLVLGLESINDPEPLLLGSYRYDENGTSLQHFLVQQSDVRPYKLIELRIESNHGNMEYTCLYRFRVHGTWISN